MKNENTAADGQIGIVEQSTRAPFGPLVPPRTGYLDSSTARELKERLRLAGLKPTRPRVGISWLLFGGGDRHVTAEVLHEEARRHKLFISLATVYNTLHQFEEAGLIRQVALFGGKLWYDTTTGPHCHYFNEDTQEFFDIPVHYAPCLEAPVAPEGMEVIGVDVVVRVRKRQTD